MNEDDWFERHVPVTTTGGYRLTSPRRWRWDRIAFWLGILIWIALIVRVLWLWL
jgi:hypothetical protein